MDRAASSRAVACRRFFASMAVDALQPHLAAEQRLLPRLGEAQRLRRAQSVVPQPPVFPEAEDPGFRPRLRDLQVQPAPVAQKAPFRRARDLKCREFAHGRIPKQVRNQSIFQSILYARIWANASEPRRAVPGSKSLGFRCFPAVFREIQEENWRRGWDSNPRYPRRYNGFRDRPNRPLWHLSARWSWRMDPIHLGKARNLVQAQDLCNALLH